eukprot:gnl/TRDRNA2_/TRDRNA2_112676_c0_seq1.p1 gnl/TRDRNA2_/TRDRNA2_112676_c0~~gnl/TRDRNA2_/TRDRNA2_112676_c0_seq1.p1  ORF type:complete len:553 (+),score=95.60 gnl/TRDRNA2_/TRDRNA2_112676_c0_seq1:63-1661(+)
MEDFAGPSPQPHRSAPSPLDILTRATMSKHEHQAPEHQAPEQEAAVNELESRSPPNELHLHQMLGNPGKEGPLPTTDFWQNHPDLEKAYKENLAKRMQYRAVKAAEVAKEKNLMAREEQELHGNHARKNHTRNHRTRNHTRRHRDHTDETKEDVGEKDDSEDTSDPDEEDLRGLRHSSADSTQLRPAILSAENGKLHGLSGGVSSELAAIAAAELRAQKEIGDKIHTSTGLDRETSTNLNRVLHKLDRRLQRFGHGKNQDEKVKVARLKDAVSQSRQALARALTKSKGHSLARAPELDDATIVQALGRFRGLVHEIKDDFNFEEAPMHKALEDIESHLSTVWHGRSAATREIMTDLQHKVQSARKGLTDTKREAADIIDRLTNQIQDAESKMKKLMLMQSQPAKPTGFFATDPVGMMENEAEELDNGVSQSRATQDIAAKDTQVRMLKDLVKFLDGQVALSNVVKESPEPGPVRSALPQMKDKLQKLSKGKSEKIHEVIEKIQEVINTLRDDAHTLSQQSNSDIVDTVLAKI